MEKFTAIRVDPVKGANETVLSIGTDKGAVYCSFNYLMDAGAAALMLHALADRLSKDIKQRKRQQNENK